MMTGGVCDRLGCRESATAALLMAPQDTEAWLIDPDHDAAPDGVGLCEIHADRITVPFGWSFSDERSLTKTSKKRRTKRTVVAKPSKSTGSESSVKSPLSPKTQKASKPKTSKVPVSKSKPVAESKKPGKTSTESTAAKSSEDDTQGAFWAGDVENLPGESTPLLKRAFRATQDSLDDGR